VSGLADRSVIKAAVALVAFGGLSACATASDDLPDGAGRASGVATITRSLSDAGLARYVADMDLAMLAVARRHDPRPHKDYWGRVRGWEKLDLHRIPRLGDREPDFEEARAINAFKASSPIAMQAAEPFVISGPTAERNKALRCLTQAVYFESGFERLEGQQAVAQTVLNRVRHPGYPKSICGVVYEGAARGSGCQFSFTCDGSLARAISPAVWSNAEIVAKRALAGFVAKDVGTATHYHADYVYPYWAPTLVKLRTVGAHVFYRWTGPSGQVSAFRGRYSPHEDVSAEIMMGADPRTLEAAPPDILAQARAETLSAQAASLAAAQASGAAPTPTGAAATINHDGVVEILPPLSGDAAMAMRGGRRAPTAEEIARINKALESVPEVAAEPARPSEPTSPTPAAPRKKSSS
jgi:spore germination cell wall hydrolase CwlJ-like protein